MHAPEITDSSLPSFERLRQLDLRDLSSLKVLVAGDFMLDEYLWGEVERISPEAPVMVVNVEHETRVLGGAGNVVNNLIGLGAQVEVLGLVGQDQPGAQLREELQRLEIDPRGLITDPGRQTTRKTRVVGGNQQIVRLDREHRHRAGEEFEQAGLRHLQDCLPSVDAIIVSDYGKGLLTPRLLSGLIDQGRKHDLPVVVDPKGNDFSRYRRATMITPNRKEAEAAVGFSLSHPDELIRAGNILCRDLQTEAILITQGPAGMTLFRPLAPALHIPAQTREVYDVSGAGDTVVAVVTLGLARWRDAALAATLANIAAGVVVGKVGTAPIYRPELEEELQACGELSYEKIVSLAELRLLVPRLQAQGKRVVFTNGCFDLLHWGHIKFLEESRRQGDVLIVALDSDASVQRVKGEGRPVIGEQQRLRMLAAFKAVDYVTLFASDQLPEILMTLRPEILTKGSNYPETEVAGHELVRSYGGEVVLIPITDAISIRGLIRQIKEGNSQLL
ncbi:MAG: D-glycero-beta-D-manno-heptose-7-phosphate kinase [Deltaproteobacteria bacterium]|nr:D-glycero-beta-D-manno-heptose-7-phosphate kinase [Deltaproteobacteria bacterium]MBW1951491.1 D-glycero-beta-D-manno-heptose-7-phosphate kinase [Deltaproteobacteria bacterium]MBW1987411.1 D-glycero-beta-D-manno-heptose-7-phosphate kinase [Deltaproteobacteria bacterium]MBW2135030.1 D-glycero-beta-D-manno-heptose-7-phosphate kinase [Deltaproteobacteria bacterium]